MTRGMFPSAARRVHRRSIADHSGPFLAQMREVHSRKTAAAVPARMWGLQRSRRVVVRYFGAHALFSDSISFNSLRSSYWMFSMCAHLACAHAHCMHSARMLHTTFSCRMPLCVACCAMRIVRCVLCCTSHAASYGCMLYAVCCMHRRLRVLRFGFCQLAMMRDSSLRLLRPSSNIACCMLHCCVVHAACCIVASLHVASCVLHVALLRQLHCCTVALLLAAASANG
jgi:hypothetical protein